MKGLIIKDLTILKIQGKPILLVMAIFLFYSVITSNYIFFGGFLTVYSAMLPITILSYDERANWDKYALGMPVTRKDLIISKYLLGVLFPVIAFILNVSLNLLFKTGNPSEIFPTSLIELGLGILFMSILLPLMFKTGVEKGRMLMMVLFLVPVALLTFATRIGLKMPGQEILQMTATIFPVVIFTFLLVSIWLSINMYQKKEF